jgi:DNA-binding SARP family transcriptional activator
MATGVGLVRLDRPDLTERILGGFEAGSLLVVADAGFGKTSALEQALAQDEVDAAWVRCGDAGEDAGRLVGLVVDAVRAAVPGAADVLAERLAATREPVDPQRAVAALGRELAPLLVDPLVVVLDDAESLDGSPAALAVVARLLDAEPPALRVAVATRHPLALRTARARAAGRLAEIGPADLAFTAADCAEFLRLAGGREPEADEVDAVMTATEGWPLGVALAVGTGEPGHGGPSRRLADAYFDEEVLGPLDAELREAVVAASAAPDLEVAAAAGIGPAEGLAAVAEQRGLFLAGGDPQGGRRFHPLFHEFLRTRLQRDTAPERRRAIEARVAEALEAGGRGREAVDHWVAAEEWDAAAHAVVREGPGFVRTAPETVRAWLAALPAAVAERPELRLLAGSLATGEGRFEEAVELCRAAVAGFDAAGAPPPVRFAARFALADAYVAVGDLAGAAALGAALDDPDADGDLAACAVGVAAAAATARQGGFAAARTLFERALADPVAAVLRPAAPSFDAYYFDLPSGRLDDALTHAGQGLAALEVADPFGRLPYVLGFIAAIHEERGEDAEALAVAARARDSARAVGLAGWVGTGLTVRSASLLAQAGDVAGAERELADIGPDWRAWGVWALQTAQAAVAAARGDAAGARTAAERALAEAEGWPYYDRTHCVALVAPTLARVGEPARSRQVVEGLIAQRPDGYSTARLQAVLAWLRHDEGDEAGSVRAIQAAWAEAGDQARHVVRREWPRVQPVLWTALEGDALDPDAAVRAVAGALPGGGALGPFTRHPVAAVRRAALLAAVAAGHPGGLERLPELAEDPDPEVADAARAAAERLRRDPPALAIRLLGGFEVRRGGWVVDDAAWDRRVAERLVRFLLCRDGEPATEDELFEAFWADKPASSARRGLQVAVSAARGVLDPPGARTSRLEAAERAYRIRLREVDRVDAHEFERAAAGALATSGEARLPALAAADALWAGEPLPEERYSDWAIPWRERLVDGYAELLAALADAHADAGDHLAGTRAARRLVELDPLNESAHRRLVAAYARGGRRGHALRQFLACRRALVAELGVEPGAETAELQRRVLAGDPI